MPDTVTSNGGTGSTGTATGTSAPASTNSAPAPAPSISDSFRQVLTAGGFGEQPQVDPAAPGSAPAATEPNSQSSDETLPAAAGAETETSETVETDPLVEDQEFAQLTTAIDPQSTRGQQLWAEHQFVRQLRQAWDKGGLGHEATPEDLRSYYQAHLTQTQILNDVEMGNPNFLAGFAFHKPESFASILTRVPEFLTTGPGGTDPRLVEAMEPVRQALSRATTESMVQEYLNTARQAATPEERKKWFDRANFISTDWLDKPLADSDLNVQKDPLADERARLQAENARINEHYAGLAKQQYAHFEKNVHDTVLPQIREFAAKQMEPFKGAPAFNAAVKGLMDTAIATLNANPQAMNEINAAWTRAARGLNGRPVDEGWRKNAQAVVQNTILKYLKPLIYQGRSATAKEFGLLKTVAKVTPQPVTGSGAPAAPMATAQPVERQPGESFETYSQRSLASLTRRVN